MGVVKSLVIDIKETRVWTSFDGGVSSVTSKYSFKNDTQDIGPFSECGHLHVVSHEQPQVKDDVRIYPTAEG